MTDRVKSMLDFLKKRDYRAARNGDPVNVTAFTETESEPFGREAMMLVGMLHAEKPVLFPNDAFGFNRYRSQRPFYMLDGNQVTGSKRANLTPHYTALIERGFDDVIRFVETRLSDPAFRGNAFYRACLIEFREILSFCDRYRDAAEKSGCTELAKALERVPRYPAQSFYEACVFMKIIIFCLRAVTYSHITLGRFDQYMAPYFESDLKRGVSREKLLETLELFFISLNFDTDLYSGVQQGDNGQSMVLGGFDAEGNDQFNDLSRLCLDASVDLCIIDPKINLRVGKATPLSRYELATELTAKGLGFPQYCNDDVVVEGLTALGYDREDALNYTVAACWEFIIPNCGVDTPNKEVFNFPLVINRAIESNLLRCETFEELMECVREEMRREVDVIASIKFPPKTERPEIFLSTLIDGCLEKGRDITELVAKYNCYGCHGAGIANAADALEAVKRLVYDTETVAKETLLAALEANFVGYSELRNLLLSCPKMGNNEEEVDGIACELMDVFAKNLNGRPNDRGGFWRAGTGSAQEYVFSAAKCPATADGRLAGEPYGSSFSPAITTRLSGPLSVVKSFTKYDLKKIINGGPLTLEVHDTVFRNREGYKKVAALVKAFIDRGGHQLQINAINRDVLLDAQRHPENYPNLIVRVWGWSGYFCELDKKFQDHIIKRTEFSF